MEEQVISISEIFEAIKKRWKMIVSITLLATILSAVISFFVINPVYESKVKLFIGKEEKTEEAYNSSDIMMYQQLLKTYAATITTVDLVEDAIYRTSYDIKTKDAIEELSVVPVPETQILEISYKSQDPKEAKDILVSVTDEFIKKSTALVPNGNVQVLESAKVAENPISPNKVMNIAIAFLLGLMVSVGLVFLLEYMDNTYKTKERLEEELGIPVLGVIPAFDK